MGRRREFRRSRGAETEEGRRKEDGREEEHNSGASLAKVSLLSVGQSGSRDARRPGALAFVLVVPGVPSKPSLHLGRAN